MLINEKIIMANSHKKYECPELERRRGYISSKMLMIDSSIQSITVCERWLKENNGTKVVH